MVKTRYRRFIAAVHRAAINKALTDGPPRRITLEGMMYQVGTRVLRTPEYALDEDPAEASRQLITSVYAQFG